MAVVTVLILLKPVNDCEIPYGESGILWFDLEGWLQLFQVVENVTQKLKPIGGGRDYMDTSPGQTQYSSDVGKRLNVFSHLQTKLNYSEDTTWNYETGIYTCLSMKDAKLSFDTILESPIQKLKSTGGKWLILYKA